MSEEESTQLAEFSPAVRRAWADALELANLQVELLTQIHDADRRGDDIEVQRHAAALDHVMDQVAAADRARRNRSDDVAIVDEPACAECGALAQPVYEAPRLLGYKCPDCGWTADDPASQAAARLDAARDAAVGAARDASDAIGAALANVRQRRKKQLHELGLRDLETLRASLETTAKRVSRAEQQLRAAQRDAGRGMAPGT